MAENSLALHQNFWLSIFAQHRWYDFGLEDDPLSLSLCQSDVGTSFLTYSETFVKWNAKRWQQLRIEFSDTSAEIDSDLN